MAVELIVNIWERVKISMGEKNAVDKSHMWNMVEVVLHSLGIFGSQMKVNMNTLQLGLSQEYN